MRPDRNSACLCLQPFSKLGEWLYNQWPLISSLNNDDRYEAHDRSSAAQSSFVARVGMVMFIFHLASLQVPSTPLQELFCHTLCLLLVSLDCERLDFRHDGVA